MRSGALQNRRRGKGRSQSAAATTATAVRAVTAAMPRIQDVMRFANLQSFIETKRAIENSNARQSMQASGYKSIRFLGQGRFGKVFLASDARAKLCAIKVLNVERDRREYNWTWLTAEERVQANADAAKLHAFIEQLAPGLVRDHMRRAEELMLDTLRREENPLLRRVRRPVAEREILLRIGPHPYIANLVTSFRDTRNLFLVFDYFVGGTLASLLAAAPSKRLAEPVAVFYAAQLLSALEFLASRNVSHRDVKPSNVLVDGQGFAALSDFGLATRLRGGLKTFCGTAEYIAPEVLSEKHWSATYLDVWAFGVTVYQLLAGRTPFEAADATSVFLNTLTAPLAFPEHFSAEARSLLSLVLSRDYERRPSIEQIKAHAFFAGVDWEKLMRKQWTALALN